jgi:hypothetical protein
MATILTKKKDTTGAPATGDLTNSSGGAELAVNTADKRLYTKNSSNAVVEIGTNPGTAVTFTAGTASDPAITTTGDTNTGIFFPAADTIAFAEGGAEAMRIDSSGRVGIGTGSPIYNGFLSVAYSGAATLGGTIADNRSFAADVGGRIAYAGKYNTAGDYRPFGVIGARKENATDGNSAGYLQFSTNGNGADTTERMRIDSSGNVGIGTSSPGTKLHVSGAGNVVTFNRSGVATLLFGLDSSKNEIFSRDGTTGNFPLAFYTGTTERMRIDSSGNLMVGMTTAAATNTGSYIAPTGFISIGRVDDATLMQFASGGTVEGSISVSGNTVSYNAFCGGHWTQLQEGRGYNPDIPRGTVMSSIGEMAVWKSVEWTETIEHPAVEAVEAVEAVLDEDGNVIEPAVKAVEGKEAWTETFNRSEAYLGNLDIGATFEEDGFTKTVIDDGNERLPKVKISDVVGDKAVYGVFQTWDDVEDMLISSLGAFVVRIASGVTVEVGDLLESNGDGCAKVQDDDIIRSKTIGKVTSTVATDTYDDGSYTVPCVLYCG